MKISPELEGLINAEFLDELVIFHLLGRELATFRIEAGIGKDVPITQMESDFVMGVFERVMNTPRKYERQEHLPIQVIVQNGMNRKFEGVDEGFWT